MNLRNLVLAALALVFMTGTICYGQTANPVLTAHRQLLQQQSKCQLLARLVNTLNPIRPLTAQQQHQFFMQGLRSGGLSPAQKQGLLQGFQSGAVTAGLQAHQSAINSYRAANGRVDNNGTRQAAAARDKAMHDYRQQVLNQYLGVQRRRQAAYQMALQAWLRCRQKSRLAAQQLAFALRAAGRGGPPVPQIPPIANDPGRPGNSIFNSAQGCCNPYQSLQHPQQDQRYWPYLVPGR